jgi:hypothetical protein
LGLGDHVEISFKPEKYERDGFPCDHEWLSVISIEGVWPDIVYYGRLLAEPHLVSLPRGALVKFRPYNIFAITRNFTPPSLAKGKPMRLANDTPVEQKPLRKPLRLPQGSFSGVT